MNPAADNWKDLFERDRAERRHRSGVIQAFQNAVPPAILYHYTSAQGLRGIVGLGKMWFTSIAFLNDASEFSYGIAQVEKALETLQTDPAFTQIVDRIYSTITDTVDPYITCLCARGDLLNQWHGYGARGGGYSLGLKSKSIQDIISETDTVLCKVQYDPATQIELIQAEIACAAESLNHVILSKRLNSTDHNSLVLHASRAVLSSLSVIISAMKDPAFSGEQEWRLVRYRSRTLEPKSDIEFRVSGDVLIPYIPTSLCFKGTKILPIAEVIIGPTVNRLAERSTKDLLRRHNMWGINGEQVNLKRSEVPLRELR